jgi:DNA-binding protein H-NS
MVGNLFSFLIQQLLSIIKTLQAKVTEEAMKKAMMELRIREEVAQEMNEQIAEIENMYRFVYDITIAGKSILK